MGDRHQASRTLDFDTEDVSSSVGRVYSTRSKVNISHNIEELEQLFVPPDITADMYDVPNEEENGDYVEFLRELFGGVADDVAAPHHDEPEVEDDPEFVYCPDEADQEIKDREELRNDKATKISRKEVDDLMTELLDFANKNNDDDNNKKKLTKRKKTDPDPIFEAAKQQSEKAAAAVSKETTKSRIVEPVEEVSALTEKERTELSLQFQQHIQLLTQMSLLSSHNKQWY